MSKNPYANACKQEKCKRTDEHWHTLSGEVHSVPPDPPRLPRYTEDPSADTSAQDYINDQPPDRLGEQSELEELVRAYLPDIRDKELRNIVVVFKALITTARQEATVEALTKLNDEWYKRPDGTHDKAEPDTIGSSLQERLATLDTQHQEKKS